MFQVLISLPQYNLIFKEELVKKNYRSIYNKFEIQVLYLCYFFIALELLFSPWIKKII